MARALRAYAIPVLVYFLSFGVASAHTVTGVAGGFISGFFHPLSGLDHISAMIAVGMWGAFLAAPAIWLLPIVFPLVMAIGGALGILGLPILGVETGIALSAIVLGAMLLFKARPQLWIAAVIVGTFAIFHGYAHGAELPEAANAITYAVGFVLATGLLHLTGIVIGLLTGWKIKAIPAGQMVIRASGVLISLVGFGFLFDFLH